MPRPANPDAKPRAAQGPRPAYVMLTGDRAKEFAKAVEDGSVTIAGATRKADEVLAKVYANEVDAFVRFMIK